MKRSAIGILAILWLAPVLMSDGHRRSAAAEQVESELLAMLPSSLPATYEPVAREYSQAVLAGLNRVPCPNSRQRAVLTRSMRGRILDVSEKGKLEAAELRTRLLDEVRTHSKDLARITTAMLNTDWTRRLKEFDADVGRLKAGFQQVVASRPGMILSAGYRRPIPQSASCIVVTRTPYADKAVQANFENALEAGAKQLGVGMSDPLRFSGNYYPGPLTRDELNRFLEALKRRLLIDNIIVINPPASDLTDCIGLALATLFRHPVLRAPTLETRCDDLRWQFEVHELLRRSPPPDPQLDPLICVWGRPVPKEMQNGSRFGYRPAALNTPEFAERRREHLAALEWAVERWLSDVTALSEGRFAPLQDKVAATAFAHSLFGGTELVERADLTADERTFFRLLASQRLSNPLFHHRDQNSRTRLDLEFTEFLRRGSVSPEKLRPGWQTAWQACDREFIKRLAELEFRIHEERWRRERANSQQSARN